MRLLSRGLVAFGLGAVLVFIAFAVAGVLDVIEINNDNMTMMFAGLATCAVLLVGGVGFCRFWFKQYADKLNQLEEDLTALGIDSLPGSVLIESPSEFRPLVELIGEKNNEIRMLKEKELAVEEKLREQHDRMAELTEELATFVQEQQNGVDDLAKACDGNQSSFEEDGAWISRLTHQTSDIASKLTTVNRALVTSSDVLAGLCAGIGQLGTSSSEESGGVYLSKNKLSVLGLSLSSILSILEDIKCRAENANLDAVDIHKNIVSMEAETQNIARAIESVIDKSDEAHNSNKRILTVTSSLESKLGGIDEVIEVIRNLAERTKLLSINASIIASEAGEHGRAFAVVANEVKDLAASTAGAISEISNMLGSLKDGFGETLKAIRQGREDVGENIAVAKDALVLLRPIPEKVQTMLRLSDGIAETVEGQLSLSRQAEIQMEEVHRIISTADSSDDEDTADTATALLIGLGASAEGTAKSTREQAIVSRNLLTMVNEVLLMEKEKEEEMEKRKMELKKMAEETENLVKYGDVAGRSIRELTNLLKNTPHLAKK